jgi:hypothetical protein
MLFVNPRLREERVETQRVNSSSAPDNDEAMFPPTTGAASNTSLFASVLQACSAEAAAAPPAAATTAPVTAATAATAGAPAQPPGISALISAIQNGSLTDTDVTDSTQLSVTTPWGNYTVSSFYYASDDTANQLATLLGGKVVQLPPFGQGGGCTEPLANFIQLPNGQTVNAASLAYYAQGAGCGTGQLAADLTQTINEGAALTNYYQNGGPMPMFPIGYTGPAISGMTYPPGTIAADGTVINPAMGNNNT